MMNLYQKINWEEVNFMIIIQNHHHLIIIIIMDIIKWPEKNMVLKIKIII